VTLTEELQSFVGRPVGSGGSSRAPDPVNVPMIRHWVDAFDDQNPIYLDDDAAAAAGFGSLVAPPAMMQTWTFSRPVIKGLAERGGANAAITGRSAITLLDEAGFTGTRATNSELEFERYLKPGDILHADTVVEAISGEKQTGLGPGHFLTWITTYRDQNDEIVGTQRFRILKFKPTKAG